MSQTHSVNAATIVRVIVRCALFRRPENVDLRMITPDNVRRVRCQSAEADKKQACAMIVVIRIVAFHTAATQNTHDGRDDSKQQYTDTQCYVMSIHVHRQCSRECDVHRGQGRSRTLIGVT